MIAQGFKAGVLVCTLEKAQIDTSQNGYDIDTIVIDGVSHSVAAPATSPIAAIVTGYADSQAERAARVELLKSTASYAIGAKIGGELAVANPPTNAAELAAIKAEAKRQASILGGDFFDRYFPQIGAYREGGGPKFLTDVQADTTTEFLDWALPGAGITLPDGAVIFPTGGAVEDLFGHFLT